MKHSTAYQDLLEQMNATGRNKMDGYQEDLLDEVDDWERAKAEKLIWDAFNDENDVELAVLMPKLRQYDGVDALKKKLSKCPIPSYASVLVARVLFEQTKEDNYFDLILENIEKSNYNGEFVSMLVYYCTPCKRTYDAFKSIYLTCPNGKVRDDAVLGLLRHKGIIHDPRDLMEVFEQSELTNKFVSEDADERARILEAFEVGTL